VAAAGAGALLMLFGMMAVGDLRSPKLADGSSGLPGVVTDVLGEPLGKLFLCDVIFAIVVCSLAVHGSTVPLTFAMARDNNLPFGSVLAHVSARSRTPVVPAVVAGVLAVAILLVNVNFPKAVEIVLGVAILWANLAYLLVTVSLLVRRLRELPAEETPATRGGFRLGRWGLPVNALAAAWGVFMVVNVGWPRAETYGESWLERWAAVLCTSALVFTGASYYALIQRHKVGVL